MPFMYSNPLFSLNLPTSTVHYTNLNSSEEIEEVIEEEIEEISEFPSSSFAFTVPYSPIVTINNTKYYKKIKKLKYFYKGKKVKKLKI